MSTCLELTTTEPVIENGSGFLLLPPEQGQAVTIVTDLICPLDQTNYDSLHFCKIGIKKPKVIFSSHTGGCTKLKFTSLNTNRSMKGVLLSPACPERLHLSTDTLENRCALRCRPAHKQNATGRGHLRVSALVARLHHQADGLRT
jgi:hypothetical protein